jgi:hypothetical protein
VVLIGGGARIPLVRSVLQSWLGLPVVVPDHPELVAAQGAALLAQQVVQPPAEVARVLPPPYTPQSAPDAVVSTYQAPSATVARTGAPSSTPSWLSAAAPPPSQQVAKPQIRGAALAGSALAVVAVIGLGLGYGKNLLARTEGSSQPVTTQLTTESPVMTQVATPSPTTPSPTPTSEAVEAPVQTASQIRIPEPAPAPPPPPPAPLFPGLPQIQLPPLQLPELPRFPGT